MAEQTLRGGAEGMLHVESITVTAVRAAPTSKGHRCHEADPVVVTGASGFAGGHLVRELQQRGHGHIRTVDVKLLDEGCQQFPGVDGQASDFGLIENCRQRTTSKWNRSRKHWPDQ
jgi:hypothetical protein